jgi:hypothetical protein
LILLNFCAELFKEVTDELTLKKKKKIQRFYQVKHLNARGFEGGRCRRMNQ